MNSANAARLGFYLIWLGTCCAAGEVDAAPVKLNGALMVDSDVETTFRFSADSSRVLYVADQDSHQVFELYSVPSVGGAALKLSGPLVSGGDVVPESVQFSPNGNRVLYAADAAIDEYPELYGVPATGGSPVKVSGALPIGGSVDGNSPRFSPDSSRIIYRADGQTDQVFEAFSVPATGGAITKLNGALANGGDVDGGGLRISPDGSRVLYVADQDTDETLELYSVPIAGGTPLKLSGSLVLGGNVASGSAQFNAAGNRVLYVADQNINSVDELFSVAASGGTPTKLNGTLASGGDVSATSSRFSPDGNRVVYRADQEHDNVFELYSVPSGGGSPVKISGALVTAGDVVENSARVSPDSSHVIYIADQEVNETFELYSVPILGGTTVKLNGVLPSLDDVTSAEFTPDGSRVIFLANEDSASAFELFSVPSAGGTPVKISGPLVAGGNVTDFQISPNGRRVVYRADEDMDDVFELYSVSLAGSSVPGDYNHNGIVDAADYTVWRDSLGKTGINLAADGDSNNIVDAADYNIWKSNFGQTSGGGSGATGSAGASVPEPSAAVLLLMGSIWFVSRGRFAKL
jgi:Tol biopolymer transport system component